MVDCGSSTAQSGAVTGSAGFDLEERIERLHKDLIRR